MKGEQNYFYGASGKTDYITPRWILEEIGPFDLDPCASAEQPYPTAKVMYAPPMDGLAESWEGLVYVNPPYGKNNGEGLFLQRLSRHDPGGIACVLAKVESTTWRDYVWGHATTIFLIDGRVYFNNNQGYTTKGYHGIGVALVAYGHTAAARLMDIKTISGSLVQELRTVRSGVSARDRKGPEA
jgi:hypothetical protein